MSYELRRNSPAWSCSEPRGGPLPSLFDAVSMGAQQRQKHYPWRDECDPGGLLAGHIPAPSVEWRTCSRKTL